MAFCIKDEATDKAARKLAKRKGKTLTAAVREAVENELAKTDRRPLTERIKPLQEALKKYPKTGKKADKAFYDWLSGEEDVR